MFLWLSDSLFPLEKYDFKMSSSPQIADGQGYLFWFVANSFILNLTSMNIYFIYLFIYLFFFFFFFFFLLIYLFIIILLYLFIISFWLYLFIY